MKKLCLGLIVLAMLCGLCACGGNADTPTNDNTSVPSSETVADTPEEPEIAKLSLGETASTDIIDFTLDSAAFSIYANSIIGNDFLTPSESDTSIGASIGHSLVILTFTANSTDRSGSISLGDISSDGWTFKWYVLYDNTEYALKDFKENNSFLRLYQAAIIDQETGKMLQRNDTTNYLLHAGDKVSFRVVGVIDTEPNTLNDAFEITINIPNSSGEDEYFSYTVPEVA